jgi:3-oxoacyl-[acyl-carrier-protein] synthase II
MKTRRVVATGIGVVTPFGCEHERVWSALTTGSSAGRIVERPNGGSLAGGPVSGFSPRDHIDGKSLRLMTPAVAFGVAAAQIAAVDSGVAFDRVEPERLGIFIGSRGHSSDREDLLPAVRRSTRDGTFSLQLFGAEGLPLVHPMWLLKGLANNVLYFLSLKYNAQGANHNLSMGGVAATMAIGEAFRAIQHGLVDVALAGGYDSVLDVDRIELFSGSGLLTQAADPARASRPFDRSRDGFLPAEGAGFLVLESLDSARQRGATPYGEVLAYGAAGGFEGALTAALEETSGITPDAVFAYGLATADSDVEETRAVKAVFGPKAYHIPTPALKSMLGNPLAASGGIEAAAALLALRDGVVPPTINLDESDEACDLDYVAGTRARPARLGVVALNNANLAGAHAALVLGRVE